MAAYDLMTVNKSIYKYFDKKRKTGYTAPSSKAVLGVQFTNTTLQIVLNNP